MKKHLLSFAAAMVLSNMLTAQWVDAPASNTFLANTSENAGEIYISTHAPTGDTYVQWMHGENGEWIPRLQRLDVNGLPQWTDDGLVLNAHTFASYSQGIAMVATTDNAAVSFFTDANAQAFLVKVNADGTFAWGEGGIGFGIDDASRTELVAGDDGGVWACVCSGEKTYLRYVNADGSLNPLTTIEADGARCIFPQLVAGHDNIVFVTYEKTGSGTWYVDKELWVAGYNTDGAPVTPPTQLMTSNTFGCTYIHNSISDGLGGGYAYIHHPGIDNAFNVYVFHFDANGSSTIAEPNGASVHPADPTHYYRTPYAATDPVSHDVIIVYSQTDAAHQQEDRLFMNRITPNGERLWNDGILIGDNTGINYSSIKIDAYPDGNGVMVSYQYGNETDGTTCEAVGYDMDGEVAWRTQMNSVASGKIGSENNSGFHNGQNIVVWNNTETRKLMGQNIDANGNMGPVEPASCPPPTNFEGHYYWDNETQPYGAAFTWNAPEETPLHYNLYRDNTNTQEHAVIEIDATETDYFDTIETGNYKYQLTAVYQDCESEFAHTTGGDDFVIIEVTGTKDNTADTLVKIIAIYNMSGQSVRCDRLEDLAEGIYVIQGITNRNTIASKKIVVKKN